VRTDDVRLRPVQEPGDREWIVEQHGRVYAAEHGWDATFRDEVAAIVESGFVAGWIAEEGGARVGCVLCTVGATPDAAQLRALLVMPSARRHGVGRMLADRCVTFARDAGYRRLSLWTVDVLLEARRLYDAMGFRVVSERPVRQFGHPMVDLVMELELGRPRRRLLP
jgi:GNAT superfamily N-acetyltransferase